MLTEAKVVETSVKIILHLNSKVVFPYFYNEYPEYASERNGFDYRIVRNT